MTSRPCCATSHRSCSAACSRGSPDKEGRWASLFIPQTVDGDDAGMADVEKLVDELTLDEKAALTAGEDLWSTVEVDRLAIPKVLVTDGPNGARGPTVPGDANAGTSVC